MDYIQIRTVCLSEDTIKREEREDMEQEKVICHTDNQQRTKNPEDNFLQDKEKLTVQ